MKTILFLALLFALCAPDIQGSENIVLTVYQPLTGLGEGGIKVSEVPFVSAGAFPEVFFDAITQSHIPQQSNTGTTPVGDINAASLAGISIRCESAADGQKKLYIIWDFSKSEPKKVNDKLIDALLLCLEKSAGKSIGLYSKFVGEKDFAGFKARILARIPEQTKEQLKTDSGGK